jgi:hypothetical protein
LQYCPDTTIFPFCCSRCCLFHYQYSYLQESEQQVSCHSQHILLSCCPLEAKFFLQARSRCLQLSENVAWLPFKVFLAPVKIIKIPPLWMPLRKSGLSGIIMHFFFVPSRFHLLSHFFKLHYSCRYILLAEVCVLDQQSVHSYNCTHGEVADPHGGPRMQGRQNLPPVPSLLLLYKHNIALTHC